MNKEQLVKAVAKKSGLTLAQSEAALNATMSSVKNELAGGGKVRLQGFGKFEVRDRATKKGRVPKTGEEIIIPAHKAPVFVPYDNLKAVVK